MRVDFNDQAKRENFSDKYYSINYYTTKLLFRSVCKLTHADMFLNGPIFYDIGLPGPLHSDHENPVKNRKDRQPKAV